VRALASKSACAWATGSNGFRVAARFDKPHRMAVTTASRFSNGRLAVDMCCGEIRHTSAIGYLEVVTTQMPTLANR
jgi:hypothetical protein